MTSAVPLRRAAAAEDIANIVTFLASAECRDDRRDRHGRLRRARRRPADARLRAPPTTLTSLKESYRISDHDARCCVAGNQEGECFAEDRTPRRFDGRGGSRPARRRMRQQRFVDTTKSSWRASRAPARQGRPARAATSDRVGLDPLRAVTFPDVSGAARATFDQANAKGGVNGCKIDYVVEDDKGDPQTATQAARDLVQNQGVVGLAGSGGLLDCEVNGSSTPSRRSARSPVSASTAPAGRRRTSHRSTSARSC